MSMIVPRMPARLLLCVLSLVSLIAGEYVASAKRVAPTNLLTSQSSLSHEEDVVSLTDFGAIGDGVSDSGPALQAALETVRDSGGGTVYVPPGTYAIVTPVSIDLSNLESAVTIKGEPSTTSLDVAGNGTGLDLTSELLVKVGESQDALTLRNAHSLLVKDIIFLGVQEVINDAHVVLKFETVEDARIEHCEFYGLASLTAGGAIVVAGNSSLRIDQTAFLGCATTSGLSTSVVQNVLWKDISITNTKFIDYGYRPDFFSKTPLAAPYSWISIGNAAALEPSGSRREAFLQNLFLDEGGFLGVSSRPDYFGPPSSAPFEVFISQLRMNVTNLQAVGLYLRGARKIFVERSHFGWSTNAAGAMAFTEVGEVVLDQVECVAHANTIIADPTVRLTVINSIYETLQTNPSMTRVIVTNNSVDDPVQYVREEFLEALGREPDSAAYFYWVGRLLNCEGCAEQVHQALATYLAAQPTAKFQLSGRITDESGAPISQVNVFLSGDQSTSTLTGADGSFVFSRLATSGHYTISASKSHYNFPTLSFTETGGDQVGDLSGELQRHTIQGKITNSTGGPIAGATLTISGSVNSTTTSDTNGDYSFLNLPGGGDFTVVVARQNYNFTTNSASVSDLGSDTNFGFSGTLKNYLISGTVTGQNLQGSAGVINDGNAPGSNVEIRLTGSSTQTAITDALGQYAFTVPAEGSYTLTPVAEHYQFSPSAAHFNNLAGPQAANFQMSAVDKVEFSSSSYEGTEGTHSVLITVSRSGDTSQPAEIRYSMTDQTARQNQDYIQAAGVLQFSPSETAKTFSVLIVDDGWAEGTSETARLALTSPHGVLLGERRIAALTIHDNNTEVTANPIEDPNNFVRQHYGDFLARQPDAAGLSYWSNQIMSCGGDQACIASRRVGVSAAFFVESEFQETGGFVFRLYRSALGRQPLYSEFIPDRGYLISFPELGAAKDLLSEEFTLRDEFQLAYPENLTAEQFIDRLVYSIRLNTGVDLISRREALLAQYVATGRRAQVLRLVAEDERLRQAEYNRAFVLMQYFGYLRRDPDAGGFEFWLNVLNNQQSGNFRGMVCAFLTSREFQERFGPTVPRNDHECALIN